MIEADLERRVTEAARGVVNGARRVCAQFAGLLVAWWDRHKATYGLSSSETPAVPLTSTEEAEALAEACLRDAREPTLTITTRDGPVYFFGAGELHEGQEVQLFGGDYGEEPVRYVVETVTESPHGTVAVMRRRDDDERRAQPARH